MVKFMLPQYNFKKVSDDMFRHSADSIKESSEKRFISKADKSKYDNYTNVHLLKSDTYNREEFDNFVSTLDFTDNTINSALPYVTTNSVRGSIKFDKLMGNTVQNLLSKVITPELEPGGLTNGLPTDFEGRKRTVYHIPVQCYDKITVIGGEGYVNIYLYDENYNYIKYAGYLDTYEVPYGVAYIKYFCHADYKDPSIRIERYDLENILSVGELQDDGTYNIPLTIHGKNLMEHEWEQGSIDGYNGHYTDKSHMHYYNRIRSKNFIALDRSQDYMYYSKTKDSQYKAAIRFFDNNYKHIFDDHIIGFANEGYIRIPENAVYVKFVLGSIKAGLGDNQEEINVPKMSVDLPVETGCMMEYGQKRSSYEPYQENVLNINSPYKLSKVDGGQIYSEPLGQTIDFNKADTIFMDNDGELYLEKNIGEFVVCPENCIDMWSERRPFEVDLDPSEVKTKYFVIITELDNCITWYHRPITSYSKNNQYIYDQDIEGCNLEGAGAYLNKPLRISIYKDRLAKYDGSMTNYIKENPFIIYYVKKEPEIIKLNINVKYLHSYDNTSVLRTKTQIQPSKILCKNPLSVSSAIKSNNESIVDLSNKVTNVTKLIEGNSYKTEMYGQNKTIIGDGEYIDEVLIEGRSHTNLFNLSANRYIDNSTESPQGVFILKQKEVDQCFAIKSEHTAIREGVTYTLFLNILRNSIHRNPKNGDTVLRIQRTGLGRGDFLLNADCNINYGQRGLFKIKCQLQKSGENSPVSINIFVPYNSDTTTHNGEIAFSIALVEGDFTDDDNELYGAIGNGIVSSGSQDNIIELSSHNGNMIEMSAFTRGYSNDTMPVYVSNDGNSVTIGDGAKVLRAYSKISYLVYLEAGKTYELSYKTEGNNKQTKFDFKYRLHKERSNGNMYITGTNNLNVKLEPVCGSGWYELNFYATGSEEGANKQTFTDICLTENYNYTVENKVRKTSIDLTNYGIEGGLKGIPGGVCDRIIKKSDGYYIEQNVGMVTTGSEDITQIRAWASGENKRWIAMDINKMSIDSNSPILCDKFPTLKLHASEPEGPIGASHWEKSVTIRFDKSIYPADHDPTDYIEMERLFAEWVKDNPITFLYPLEVPVLHKIREDFTIDAHDGRTCVSLYSGHVNAKVSFVHKGNLQSTVNILKDKVRRLSDSDLVNAKFTLNSTYDADYTNYSIQLLTTGTFNNGLRRDVEDTQHDEALYEIIQTIISSGRNNYDYDDIEQKIDFFTIIDKLSFDMSMHLFSLLEEGMINE